jgi:hypothetical protein
MFNNIPPIIKIIGSSEALQSLREKLATFTPEQIEETLRGSYKDDNFFNRILEEARNKDKKASSFEDIFTDLIIKATKKKAEEVKPTEQAPQEVRIDLMNMTSEDIQNLPKEDLESILNTLDSYSNHIQSNRDMVWNMIMLREQEAHNSLTEIKVGLKDFIININSLVSDVKIQMPEIDKAKSVVAWIIHDRLLVVEQKTKQILSGTKTVARAIKNGEMICDQPEFFSEQVKILEDKLIRIDQAKHIGENLINGLTAAGY